MWSFVLFCLVVVAQVSGQDSGELEMRITGGQETVIENFPYQVSILINNRSRCGGFIISQSYILSAAHCFYQYAESAASIYVTAGNSSRTVGTVIAISEFKTHPEYGNNSQYDLDIAYLKTSNPIPFSDLIQPVKLPSKNRPVSGNVTVTGWGVTQEKNPRLSDTLMVVEIPVVDLTLCKKTYQKGLVTDNMWCGGNYEHGGVGPCQGDSGGAAVQDGIAIGIVSFGSYCGGAGLPIVFTNTAASPVRDFISENTGE